MTTLTVDKLLTPSGALKCASCGADARTEAEKCWHCYAVFTVAPAPLGEVKSAAHFVDKLLATTKNSGLHYATLEGLFAEAMAAGAARALVQMQKPGMLGRPALRRCDCGYSAAPGEVMGDA